MILIAFTPTCHPTRGPAVILLFGTGNDTAEPPGPPYTVTVAAPPIGFPAVTKGQRTYTVQSDNWPLILALWLRLPATLANLGFATGPTDYRQRVLSDDGRWLWPSGNHQDPTE